MCLPIVLAHLFVCVCQAAASSASTTEFEAFYNKWKSRPVSKLKEQGVDCIRKNDYGMALTFFNMIARRYDAGAPADEQLVYVSAYINAGGILAFNYADYQQAYSYLMNAYDISRRFNLRQTMPYIYANLGSLYGEMDDAKQAIQYFSMAMNTSLDCSNWYAATVVAANIFMYAMEHNNLDTYYPLVTKLQREGIPDSVASGRFLNSYCRALQMVKAERYHDALKACDSMAANVNDKVYETPGMMLSMVHKTKAHVYSYMKMYGSALSECRHSTALIEQCDPSNLMIRDNYLTMSNLYNSSGRLDSAYACLEKARSFRTAVPMAGRATTKDRLETLYKLEKTNVEIDKMTQRSRILTVAMVVFFIVCVAVAALLYVTYRHNKRLKEKNRQIYQNNMNLLERDKSTCRQLLEYQSKIALYEDRMARVEARAAVETESGELSETTGAEDSGGAETTKEKYHGSSLSESGKIGILQKIQQVMEENDDIYSTDFSIGKLAQLVDANPKYISQVINELYKKNFSSFLGEYRIKEVCRRLAAPGGYGVYTIEAVSAGVGFKSRSAFFTMFKKVTGITPSEYVKVIKGQKGL